MTRSSWRILLATFSLSATCLILALDGISHRWQIGCCDQTLGIAGELRTGWLRVLWWDADEPMTWNTRKEWEVDRLDDDSAPDWPVAEFSTLWKSVAIPLTPIGVLLLVGSTFIIAFFYGSREPASSCSACAYNLTGNVSGRCPECGTPIERTIPT